MPTVKSLYDLSVATLGMNIANVVENLLREESTSFDEITEPLEGLFLQAQDLPPCYHAKIIDICLEVACLLSRSQCCSKREFAVKHLISILTRLKPKKIALPFRHGDFKILKFAVFDNFKHMAGLEKLKFQFPENCSLGEHQFLTSCPALKNLVSFSASNATNAIARAICENCCSIQEIDLSCSKKVTNKCITNLIKCKKLRKVELSGTFVSTKGYTKLLLRTQSIGLLDIGSVDDLDTLLHRLKKQIAPGHTFQLQKISGEGNITNLHLVPTLFPNIIKLRLDFYEFEGLVPDIAPLDRLKNVEEVVITFSPEAADVFTNFNSHVLTYLDLSYWPNTHTLDIKITTIMKIGLQCPNIDHLDLCSFSFVDDIGSVDFYKLLGRPFQKLRNLSLSCCSQASCFKVILGHTFRIEGIEILGGDSSLTDEFFEYIVNSNPLERLETLMIGSECKISAHILKRVISHCKKIYSLGDFSKFVTLTEQQVEEIRSLVAKKVPTVEMRFDSKLKINFPIN